jgi:cytoskeletal protein CcmA (bactofilin family)
MRGLGGNWNDVRGRGFLVSVIIAFLGSTMGFAFYTVVTAKAPGETHCYGGICHRVYTLDETQRMVGRTVDVIATHYDAPGVDKYNVGQYTSSGEEFDASNPARAAASNYPDGTELLVWHPETKRAAHIRVNDFGPFMGQRTLDVTRKVAENMGFATRGVATLKVTVIWVQSATDPNYRKGRNYPASLGLIGIVEPHQIPILVERLIASAHARNRLNSPPPALVALLDVRPPGFRAEAITDAPARARALDAALLDLSVEAAKVVVAELPLALRLPTLAAAPEFRSEALADADQLARGQAEALARALPATPLPETAASVPTELVAVTPSAGVDLPTVEREIRSASPQSPPAEAGRELANRSTVAVAAPQQRDSAAAQTPVASVSLARRSSSVVSDFSASPLLWIGIGLMLTSLWGAATFGRSRRAQAQARALSPKLLVRTPAEAVAVARLALDQAEADARDLLAREAAERQVVSEADFEAREELARELAMRDTERERETAMRSQVQAAAAAHHRAVQDLAALEASRAQRTVRVRATAPVAPSAPAAASVPLPPAVQPPMASIPSVAVAAPIPAKAQPAPPRAAANDLEMASLPGLTDRKLAGAVLGLPGAAGFWGNTIIAQSKLDGTVKSGSALRVDGIVDGACFAPVILVSAGAVVRGMVAADTIIVLGTVQGILTARNILVAGSGQIEGEVFYQTMSIDPQAQCDVSFSRLQASDDPVALGSSVYAARVSGRAA